VCVEVSRVADGGGDEVALLGNGTNGSVACQQRRRLSS